MKSFLKNNLLYIAWLQALIATLGSLFFSEIMKFSPCTLCWYQRILMYPLVVLLALGIVRKSKEIYIYILPFSILGIIVSLYHNLLYYNILPESVAPCVSGVSCTTKFIELFGFITIPLLSFIAFSVITISLILYKKINK